MARVLLCDDDESIRRSLSRVLVKAGHDVTTADEPRAALGALQEAQFDVVLSDICMPGLSGLDLLREVRKRDLDVPVLLMTAVPELESAIRAIELGAFRYIRKPFEIQEILEAVDRAARMNLLAKAKREALELSGHDERLLGDRASLEARFDAALASLWMAFQPIVSVRDRRVFAYEALLRTDEPTLKNPLAFVTAAEKLKRIHELGRRVRRAVAAAAMDAPPETLLFVNLHPEDLLDPDLLEGGGLGHCAGRVALEVTERASLEHVHDLADRVRALRNYGYQIVLDDLGAGYAGLSSMTTLAPDIVKLDMSLVRGIHLDERRQRVGGSLITLCEELKMRVVIEGVESSEERDAVSRLGGSIMQGYHFARPERGFREVVAEKWP